jgi:antitoxin (DNA-binding transcriptional repressor) of toxin-antitoxin stability system
MRKSIEDASAELGRIVDAARSGEITILTRDGQAAAVVASGHCAIEPLRAALAETLWGHGDEPMIVPRSELGRWFRDMVAAAQSSREVAIAERGRVFIKVLPASAMQAEAAVTLQKITHHGHDELARVIPGHPLSVTLHGERIAVLVAVEREPPAKAYSITKARLYLNWPEAMAVIDAENALVVVMDQGRICAGIVADFGERRPGSIKLSSLAAQERQKAVVAGRETQITRNGRVVAKILLPGRIADYMPGWSQSQPMLEVPFSKLARCVSAQKTKPKPKVEMNEPPKPATVAPAIEAAKPAKAAPRAPEPRPKAPKTPIAVPTSILPAAERRRLIAEAAEQRQAAGTATRKAPRRARPLSEHDFPKEEELFDAPDSLDEILGE